MEETFDIHKPNNDEKTPLSGGHLDIRQLLIEKDFDPYSFDHEGLDIHKHDKKGKSALFMRVLREIKKYGNY